MTIFQHAAHTLKSLLAPCLSLASGVRCQVSGVPKAPRLTSGVRCLVSGVFLTLALFTFTSPTHAATQNASNQRYANNADGFSLGGGATPRLLTVTGGDITLTGGSGFTYTYPGASTTLVGTDTNQVLTNKTWNGNTIGVDYGGTGAATLTGILKGNGAAAFTGLTGTQNYVTRWTDANTIGNSIIFDNGSNVGISNASPQAKLSVDGAIYGGTTAPSHAAVDLASSGDAMFGGDVEVDGSIYIDGGIYGDGSHLTGISGAISGLSATRVPVASSGTTIVDSAIYDVGGNIGIGATSMNSKLNVAGDIALTGAARTITSESIAGGSSYALTMRTANGAVANSGALYLQTGVGNGGASGDINIQTGAGATSGNINIIAPAAGTSGAITIASQGGSAASSLVLTSAASSTLTAGNGQALTLTTASGGVPGAISIVPGASPGGGSSVTIAGANSAISGGHVKLDGGAGPIIGDVLLNTVNAGKVGIGVATPYAKLSVDGAIYGGTAAPSHSAVSLASSGDAMFGGDVEVDGALYIDNGIYGTGRLDIDGDLYVGTSTLFTLNGNVGIGLTTPEAKLNIASGSIVVNENQLATAATITVDWSNGNQQFVTLNQVGHEIALSNVKAGQGVRLVLCQDGAGSRTVTTWDADIVWGGGSAPTLTAAADKCDVISFLATEAKGSLKVFATASANF